MVSRFGVAALTQLIKSLGGKAVTRRNISFLGGKGPKQSLFNKPLSPREISTSFGPGTKAGVRDLNPQVQSLLDDSFGYLNSNKLNDIQKTILGNNLTNLRNFQLKPPPTLRGGIITSQSFKDLYRAGGRGSDFRDLGARLARQRKNRFPGKVTKEVQAVLKEIDNRIVAKGDITIKQFNSLSEIQKNRLRRIEEPSIAELFPFLKFAEGGIASLDKPKRGLVDEPGSYAGKTLFGDIAEIDIGESLKQTGSGFLNLFSPSQIMELLSGAGEGFKQIYFNLKSNAEKEDLLKEIIGNQYAKGGMVKDKGLANILAV